ncbi:hypothetical protein [Halorubrum kocurii]|uniref:Uncharacterized protein n=1 Tax=Halorubrum kocurii JCM 14978 TaxID=1230456 RepID=M0NP23_9EURY|nr:hypothetical protein [Halorubrum kocurii]EMA59378.1 hypothetical protein C468_14752 [Halorubrum kocurii JCM 14978]
MALTDDIDLDALTPLHWVGIATAAVTGGYHLVSGVQIGGGFGAAFAVAAAGFALGIAAVLVGYRRRAVYLLGIPFTAGQIVLWYLLNDVPPIPPTHALDKTAQVVLIAVLVVLLRREA